MGLGSGRTEILAARLRVDPFLAGILALCLTIHLVAAPHYGYFRDEYYYLACAKRLDWGYVDHPPLSVALLAIWTKLFGTAVWVIRLPVILAHLGSMLMASTLAGLLGGSQLAKRLAACAVFAAPVYLMLGHLYAMNGLDVFLSYLLVYFWLRSAKEPRFWILWGVTLGLGLENKWSMLWLLGAMGVAMLATGRRSELIRPGPWLGLLIALSIFAPNLIWQAQHQWPTLEFMRNALRDKLVPVPAWQFVLSQVLVMNVAAAPLLFVGLTRAFEEDDQERFVPPVVGFLAVTALLLLSGKSRVNYLTPSYALLVPVGAVLISRRLSGASYPYLLAASGLAHSLFMMPILPASQLETLYGKLPSPPAEESGSTSTLQGFADMYGWKEMADATWQAYNQLSEEERKQVVIVTTNYGEAAALEFYGLPNVQSGHNQYWLWRKQAWDGKVAILVGVGEPWRGAQFESASIAAKPKPSLAVPEERNASVRIGRNARYPNRLIQKRFL